MSSKLRSCVFAFFVCLCIQNVVSVKLQKGDIYLTISQQHQSDVNMKVNINSKVKTQLELTQSSKIKIEAKPEYFSFRLRHATYENLSEPVLAKYDSQEQSYTVTLDLGEPKQIRPFSDKYQLQVILADQQLDKNVRNVIADCNVKFRKSLDAVPSTDLHYKTQSIIQTSAPGERVDPPKIFTLFILLLVLAIDAIFVYGLNHLKVNAKLFPTSSSGFLTNVGLLVILMCNLSILFKFWINWTFLQSLQYISILMIPTVLVANYALVHVRKH